MGLVTELLGSISSEIQMPDSVTSSISGQLVALKMHLIAIRLTVAPMWENCRITIIDPMGAKGGNTISMALAVTA